MTDASTIKVDKNAQFLAEYLKLKPEESPLVEVLYANQGERDVLEEDYNKEKAALDAKYRQLYAPLYKCRREIVAGKEVQKHTVVEGESLAAIATKYSTTAEDLKKYNTLPTDTTSLPAGTVLRIVSGEKASAGVPKFWLTVLQNHPNLAEQISEKDVRILELLEDIEEEDLPGGAFKLKFIFKQPNSFFSEQVLEKSIWAIEQPRSQEVEVVKDAGCKVSWTSPSVNPTIKVMKKKSKPGQRDSKPAMKIEQVPSFFKLFETKVENEIKDEELTDDAAAQMEMLEEDYMIAVTLREEILPEAAKWYTGQAKLEYEQMFDEDEDEDEFEGDEDEDDDEDDDDVGGAPAGAAPKQIGADGAKAGEQPPECKQQ